MKFFKKAQEDLKIALGQCFWIGLDGISADFPSTVEIFRNFCPGGIVLFLRNIESIDQVKRLNSDLQGKSRIPLFIAIDQEGGTVERLHMLIGSIPPAMAFSAARSKRLIRKVHTLHAQILHQLGFNVNFTPTLDLALSAADNGLGTRCFSDDPKSIVKYAREVIRAYEESGVQICGKHFPGLGDTDRDSHFDLPTVPRPWKQILREDLFPYRKLLRILPFIMVNHALYPGKNPKLPASLAPEIVSQFLLQDWNYSGLSISDDLIMGAVSNMYNLTESAERALLAGNHLFLVCKPDGVVTTFKRLLARARSNEALRNQIFHNCARVLSFKFHMAPSDRKGNLQKEIRNLQKYSNEVGKASITLIHGTPVKKVPNQCTLYLARTKWLQGDRSALADYLQSKKCSVTEYYYAIEISPAEARQLAKKSRTDFNVILIVNSPRHAGQQALLKELMNRNKKVAVISGSFPRESFPQQILAAVAAYWTSPSTLKEAGRVLFGEQKAHGVLPLKNSTEFF
jgi:beta-N-acetylhexosaminidase